MTYSYSWSHELEQEWTWSERYAGQPEILRYLEHVADRFELRPHLRLGTRVEAASFDEGEQHWTVVTDGGDRLSAAFLVMATGLPLGAAHPGHPGPRALRRRAPPHRPLAA